MLKNTNVDEINVKHRLCNTSVYKTNKCEKCQIEINENGIIFMYLSKKFCSEKCRSKN